MSKQRKSYIYIIVACGAISLLGFLLMGCASQKPVKKTVRLYSFPRSCEGEANGAYADARKAGIPPDKIRLVVSVENEGNPPREHIYFQRNVGGKWRSYSSYGMEWVVNKWHTENFTPFKRYCYEVKGVGFRCFDNGILSPREAILRHLEGSESIADRLLRRIRGDAEP